MSVPRPEAQARRRSPHPRRPPLGLQQRGRHRRDAADAVRAGRRRAGPFRPRPVPRPRLRQSARADLRAHRRARSRPAARPLAARASAERGAGAARAAVSRAVLPAGVRRVRRAAGPGARPLRRRGRRADRHARAWRLRAEVEAAVAQGGRTRRPSSGRTTPARASSNSWPPWRVSWRASGRLPAEIAVREQGVDFVAPLRDGQKTGWFYDQTANRARLRALPAGRRARAGRVQLRGRLGRHRAQGRRGQRHLRGFLRHRARLRRRAMRAPTASTSSTIKAMPSTR